MIDKEFVEKTVELSEQWKMLENEIDKRHDGILNRVIEMRFALRKVLDELRNEFDNRYDFDCYRCDGTQEIIEVRPYEDHFVAVVTDYCLDGEYSGTEETIVPYDELKDDEFVQQFKEKARQEYLEKNATKEKDEYLKAKNTYDKLKKNFESF